MAAQRRVACASLVVVLWAGCGVVFLSSWLAEANAVTHDVIAKSFLLVTLAGARAVHVFLNPGETGVPKLALTVLLVLAAVIFA
ncbi:MAG: hypothetical protein ACYS99_21855, partial [Planctomycetota bacterium]